MVAGFFCRDTWVLTFKYLFLYFPIQCKDIILSLLKGLFIYQNAFNYI